MLHIPPHLAGKYLALRDDTIIASGTSYLEVYTKAQKTHPQKLISLFYAPTKEETITFL